jgi:arsenate reductase (thioredoxin)
MADPRDPLVLAGGADAVTAADAGPDAPHDADLPRVLFVCVENSNRSQMAEAFARMHGAGRVEAISAGSRPSRRVNPKAIAAMAARGYDLTTHRSNSLDEIPKGPYAAVVTMGCGDACPWVPAERREDWALPDPRDLPEAEFAAVRDEIERRVVGLLGRLGAPTHEHPGTESRT